MTTAPSSPPDPAGQLLARVAQVAERVQREVVLARFVGKLAVDQGVRQLRDRIVPRQPVPSPDSTSRAEVGDRYVAPVEPVDDDDAALSPDELALADYDHLSSSQIVAKLGDLEPSERARIGSYERANRHRRTILGKLDQLGVS